MTPSADSAVPSLVSSSDLAAREEELLAPYATKSRDSRGRRHAEGKYASRGTYRGVYQRDRERIIHCTAFRRLEYKTQVFVNHEGDHYRTRLTHTMEVAQISRAIARALNVNEDLTEAVALAHDLGHTPFGHSGEDALRELMKGHGGFEHNIHGLRVVDVLEHHYAAFRGLNLTWEVRESIAKHTTTYDHPTVATFDPELQMTLEGQIVEAADGIAYISHDLDDALGAHMLSESVYDEVDLLSELREQVMREDPELSGAFLRSTVVRALINRLVTDVCDTTAANIEAQHIGSVEDVRRASAPVVGYTPELDRRRNVLQEYLFANVYRHYRVSRMADKARRFVTELFTAYVGNERQLPPYYQAWAKEQGKHQAVCDYIAGMTDRYAQDEYKKLFMPYERV